MELEWKPHIIDPTVSVNGELFVDYCRKRWGSTSMMDRVFSEGAKEGAKCAGWKWWANSSLAHQWVQYGLRIGVPSVMTSKVLFDAHFERGENVSHIDILLKLAKESFPAWDQDDLRSYLQERRGEAALEQELARGRNEDGCRSVPYFIVQASNGDSVPITGSHPADSFVERFEELENKMIGEDNADIRMEIEA